MWLQCNERDGHLKEKGDAVRESPEVQVLTGEGEEFRFYLKHDRKSPWCFKQSSIMGLQYEICVCVGSRA